MADDLDQAGQRLIRVAVALSQDINLFVGQVVMNVTREVIYRTPADTGLARSNWQVTIGNPTNAIRRTAYNAALSRWRPVPGLYPGLDRSESQNAGPANENAQDRALLGSRNRLADQTYYIQNNLPYITRLANGWSKQSAPGEILAGIVVGKNRAVQLLRFPTVDRVLANG